MEKTERAWVYPARFGWSDIDNWDSLYANYPDKDDEGNVTNSRQPYLESDAGCMILSRNPGKMMAVKGLKDFLVIDTPDALLICPRDDAAYRDFTAGLAMPGFEDIR